MQQLSKIIVAIGLFVTSAQGAPATQPAVGNAAGPGIGDVYLLPFTAVGDDRSLDWAGKAVQENLLTDLSRTHFHAVAADKAIADITVARKTAAQSKARYLITGTYQLAEELVRFNGQLIDVKTGEVVGGLSATGAPRDLFSLEDSLSSQAISQLQNLNAPGQNKPAVAKLNKPLPDSLQAPSVLDAIQPPAVAAPGAVSHYDGSALQQYVDADRTPSTEYAQQLQDANYRNTYGSFNNYGYGYGYGLGGLYTPYYFGGGYGLTYSIHYGGYLGGYYGSGNYGHANYGGGFYSGHRQHIVNADR